jgi:putative transposon-encoded protein
MPKQLQSMTFETEIKQGGNSGRIIVPHSLIGKKVRVTVEVLR